MQINRQEQEKGERERRGAGDRGGGEGKEEEGEEKSLLDTLAPLRELKKQRIRYCALFRKNLR